MIYPGKGSEKIMFWLVVVAVVGFLAVMFGPQLIEKASVHGVRWYSMVDIIH